MENKICTYSFLKLQNRDYILHVLRQQCARFMHIARCAGALHILHYYKDFSYMDGTLIIANFHLANETRLIIFNLIIHHKIAPQNQLKFIRLYFIPPCHSLLKLHIWCNFCFLLVKSNSLLGAPY